MPPTPLFITGRVLWLRVGLALSSIVCVAAVTNGQQPVQAGNLVPASQVDLPRLVDLCAERLLLRIEYDPGLVKGPVTLRVPAGLDNAELWSLTNQLLAQRGLTTVRSPGSNTISVVKAADAAQIARVEQGAAVASSSTVPEAGFASLVLAPSRRSTKDLAEALRPLLTKGVGTATPLGDTRLLLVSDFSTRLRELQSLIDRLDAPVREFSCERVTLKHADAALIVDTINKLRQRRDALSGAPLSGEVIPAPDGVGLLILAPIDEMAVWNSMIEQFDTAEPVETRNYSPRVFTARDVAQLIERLWAESGGRSPAERTGPRVVVDDLTGVLIVTGSLSQHSEVESLVQRLDAAEQGSAPMRAFPVRNRPVREMLSTLSQLIDSGVLPAGGGSSDAGLVRSGAEQQFRRDLVTGEASPASGASLTIGASPRRDAPEDPVSPQESTALRLTADEATNTLVAIGSPQQLSHLNSLLQLLDVRQPQVMLEAVLVSVTDTDALNLGVELEKLGNVGDAAYKIASLFGLSSSANGARSVADTTGFTGAVLNPGEFSVVVKALQAINKGRSLSNPKVLVANNEQARFSSVLQQPFVRTDTTSSTATSSFGGSDSAGTTISVRPQIAQGDHLVLTYSINLSSFVGTPAAAGLPPPKQQNSVDSVATIPDGHVVVVGGLDLESESTSTSQIPLLGDIPVVGEVFKSRSVGKSRTRFFVFIRASVMRHGSFEDLKFISAEDTAAMRVPDGWPEVEPRIIR